MAGRFSNSLINQVQQANDIVDVISEHVGLTKKGREMVALCPFHEDHRPSMYVNPVKQIFKCFACGAGGSIFTFVQMRENLTFPQAIERLAERVGIQLPSDTRTSKTENQQSTDPNRLAKANAWAAEHFCKNLADKKIGKSARDYLDQRQITLESIKKWQLGLAIPNNDLLKIAKAKNASIPLLIEAGLVTAQNRDKFTNRLMFPITDVTGRVIGFGGRTLNNADAKYINSPTSVLFDKSNSMYGLEQARRQIVATGTAIVVEGYTDCIMAHQFGCSNVVATLGTSFTNGHGRILKRYAKRVVLIFDSDIAGVSAANRALEVCLSHRIDIKLASVPQGKDPCDFLLSAGKEQFEELAEKAIDVFQFKWNRLTESFSRDDTLIDAKSAVEEFLNTISTSLQAGNMSAIDRGLIVNRLSKIIGLNSEQINAELTKRIRRAQSNAAYTVQNQKVVKADLGRGLFAAIQREILEVLLNKPELFKNVKQKITLDDFDVPALKQIAEVLFETLAGEPNPTLTQILANLESTQASASLVELAKIGEQKGNFEVRLTAALKAIHRHQQRSKISRCETGKNQEQLLQHLSETTTKENRHNIGMV